MSEIECKGLASGHLSGKPEMLGSLQSILEFHSAWKVVTLQGGIILPVDGVRA